MVPPAASFNLPANNLSEQWDYPHLLSHLWAQPIVHVGLHNQTGGTTTRTQTSALCVSGWEAHTCAAENVLHLLLLHFCRRYGKWATGSHTTELKATEGPLTVSRGREMLGTRTFDYGLSLSMKRFQILPVWCSEKILQPPGGQGVILCNNGD